MVCINIKQAEIYDIGWLVKNLKRERNLYDVHNILNIYARIYYIFYHTSTRE